MLTSRTFRLSLLTVLCAVLGAVSTAPAASAAMQRYASPNGLGDCSSASPCSITNAINGAGVGDEVIVNPGDYALTSTLDDPAPITIHGVPGKPRPRLIFGGAGSKWLLLDSQGSVLRYVEINQTGAGEALVTSGATVDQVIAKGSGAPAVAIIGKGAIQDSIVVASATNGRAIQTVGGTSTSSYRNVTAISAGSGGVAIEAFAVGALANVTIFASNVISRGGSGGHSFVARTDGSGAAATVSVARSNWSDGYESGTNAWFLNAGGNQGSTPAFVNAAGGDYRQAAGSPTINAGLNDPTNGQFDVDGDPRTIGTTDIGADEFVVAPAATTGAASAVTDHSATLSGSVNANGVPTTYRFEYGPTTAFGSTTSTTDVGSGTGAVAAAATLGGLSPATTYHYRLVATNAGGVTKGADQTFTTAALPPAPSSSSPAPSSPAPAPTSTTQTSTTQTAAATPAFAGVRLVATRLSFGGRFITLRLSCPAGTVGRCTGRTKLSARRRASSGAARSVTLARAPFSIASGRQARVRVRVSRGGRRLLSRVRRLRGRDVTAARDAAGRSKTTVAAVTLRRRPR